MVASREEICISLDQLFKLEEFAKVSIATLRKAYGGIDIITSRLLVEAALKLLVLEKVWILWVFCRLRELL